MMWFQFLIIFVLFNILFASPPGSRDGKTDKNHQINSNSQDDKRKQQSTGLSHFSQYDFGSEPQRMPLDLSTKNRQIIQYAPPSTSGAKNKLLDRSQHDQSYSAEKNLKRHGDTKHKDPKLHKCPDCDYTSMRKSDIQKHVHARHEGLKPYECPYCDYRATQKGNLKTHVLSKHQGTKNK